MAISDEDCVIEREEYVIEEERWNASCNLGLRPRGTNKGLPFLPGRSLPCEVRLHPVQ